MHNDLPTITPTRFAVHIIRLNRTIGSEIRKDRPCVVVSPDEMNRRLGSVMVAPMTSKSFPYLSRVKTHFRGRDGLIALDQILTVEQSSLSEPIGKIAHPEERQVIDVLGKKIFTMPSHPLVSRYKDRLAHNRVYRFGVYTVKPDPIIGMETQKHRLCVVVSPDNMNSRLNTVIIASIHHHGFYYPTRVKISVNRKKQFILLDQIRAVDKSRLPEYHGTISTGEARQTIDILRKMFPY